jgi:hypothetical protein
MVDWSAPGTPIDRRIGTSLGAVLALVALGALNFWLLEPRLEQWLLIVFVGLVASWWGECVGTCREQLLLDERERTCGPLLWLTDPVVNDRGFVEQRDLSSGAVIETNPRDLTFADAVKTGGSARVIIQGVEIPFVWRQDALKWVSHLVRKPDEHGFERATLTEAEARNIADLQRQDLERAAAEVRARSTPSSNGNGRARRHAGPRP